MKDRGQSQFPLSESPLPPLLLLFYSPEKDDTLATVEISGEVYEAIITGAKHAGLEIGEFISQAVDLKNCSVEAVPKIPKGFFLVNIAACEQKELRAIMRPFGIPLRSAINWAIRSVKSEFLDKLQTARHLGIDPRACMKLVAGSERN
jgi:hypothetical protein